MKRIGRYVVLFVATPIASIAVAYLVALFAVTLSGSCAIDSWHQAPSLPEGQHPDRLVAGGGSGAYVQTIEGKLYRHSSFDEESGRWRAANEDELEPKNLADDCSVYPKSGDPEPILPLFGKVNDQLSCELWGELPVYYQYRILDNGKVWYWSCLAIGLGGIPLFVGSFLLALVIGLVVFFAIGRRLLFKDEYDYLP